jgi:hypothetical protein
MRETSAAQFLHILRWTMAAWTMLLILPAAVLAQATSKTSPNPVQSAGNQGVAMQQFVLIFRQGTSRTLSAEEQAARFKEIKAWAKEWTDKGYRFDPRQLSQQIYLITPTDGEAGGEKRVINLLFLTAKDFDDAVKAAKTHPGVRYGTEIEVRGWAAPGAPATPAQ